MRTEGIRERTPWFEIRTLVTTRAFARVAVVVPRFGNTAVARNRVKRRLRELVRRVYLPTLSAADVVIRATPLAYRATFDELRASMDECARRVARPPGLSQ